MTRDELLDRMKARRLKQETVAWAEFAQVIQGFSQAQKNNLMTLLNESRADSAGSLLVGLVTNLRRDKASDYVEAKAADDTWNTDELLELLGD